MNYRIPIFIQLVCMSLAMGCAADASLDSEGLESFAAQCLSSSDCPSGTVCRVPYNICVTSEHNVNPISVAATPTADSGMTVSHLGPLNLAPDNTLNLQLPETITLSGVVRVEGNLAEASVPSTLIALAKEEVIKGSLMRAQANATEKGFSLLLEKNRIYRLSIRIDDADPPRPVHYVDVSYDTDQSLVALELPPLSSYPVISGRIFWETDGVLQPLKNVQVTGLHSETREQCTTDETNNLGAYELRCPTTAGKYHILVSPTADGPTIPSFKVRFSNAPTVGLAEEESAQTRDYVVIDSDKALDDVVIVNDDAQKTEATIHLKDSDGKGVAGVPVTIMSALTETPFWTDAVFKRKATTDVNGIATFSVLAKNLYRVVAAPHPSSPLSLYEETQWNVDVTPTLVVPLEPKTVVKGSIIGFNKSPVANAEIVAYSEQVNPETNTTSVREYMTSTAPDGSFELLVDEASLLFRVEPPVSSGLPRVWLNTPLQATKQGLDLGVIRVEAPSLVEGLIVSESTGIPIEGVSVDFYSQSDDGQARLVARSQSDKQGRYLVVLPCPKQ